MRSPYQRPRFKRRAGQSVVWAAPAGRRVLQTAARAVAVGTMSGTQRGGADRALALVPDGLLRVGGGSGTPANDHLSRATFVMPRSAANSIAIIRTV